MDPTPSPRARLAARACGLLFVAALPFTLLTAEIGRLIFAPADSKQLLIRTALNREAIPLGLAWLSQLSGGGNPTFGEARLFRGTIPLLGLLDHMTLDDWREVAAELLPSKMAARWITATVEGMERWLQSEQPIPRVSYDLRPLKERALSSHGLRALEISLQAAPPCEPEDVTRLEAAADPEDLKITLLALRCSLPEAYQEDQLYAHAGEVPKAVAEVRDTFTLEEALLLEANPSARNALEFAKVAIRRTRTFTRFAPAVPLSLLVVILVLVGRSWRDLAKAWNPWLAAGGLATVLLALLAGEMIRWLLERILAGVAASELLQATQDFAMSLASEIARPLFVRGSAALLLSAALAYPGRWTGAAEQQPGTETESLAERV